MKENMLRTCTIYIFFLMIVSGYGQTQQGSDGLYYDGKGNLFSGIYTEYYTDCLTRTTVEVENGRPNGLTKVYFENGQLEEIRSFKNGMMHGKWEKWNPQDIKIAEANYSDNKKDGKWYIWDENGTLRYDMTYVMGEKRGTWLMYNENGILLDQKEY